MRRPSERPVTGGPPRLCVDTEPLADQISRPRAKPGAGRPHDAVMIQVVSSLSSGRAWTRSRISSTITDAIVMAFRHDLARASRPAHAHKAG